MIKRIMHCVTTAVVCALIALLLALAMPHEADAIPAKFRNCPRVTKTYVKKVHVTRTKVKKVPYKITYLLYRDAAIVTRTKGKDITIPYSVKHCGRRYIVRAIWDGALSDKRLCKIDLKAFLETCEDDSLFVRDARNIEITVHRDSDFKWLTQGEPCCNSLVSLM